MNSLIENTCWQEQRGCAPRFFALEGPITYDSFSLGGCRTCSLTQCGNECESSCCRYLPSICVRGKKQITWGFLIRAIDVCCVLLAVDFYDQSKCHIKCVHQDISSCIGHEFIRNMCCFDIPRAAVSAKLSISFAGKITACTFYAPSAHF